MDKIVAITMAYNAEKTLHRAVDSILNQTFGNFVYYLVDNGSQDGTRGIIRQYARRDARINPIFFDENDPRRYFSTFQLAAEEKKGNLMAVLDGDDEYTPDFFDHMTAFMHHNRLQFAATGNQFIDAASGRHLNDRAYQQDVFISDDGFANVGSYYGMIRTMWGKLFAMNLVERVDFSAVRQICYGGDTAFCLDILSHCERFGILGGTYHKYYMNPHSGSYAWNSSRQTGDAELFDAAKQMLAAKFGLVPAQSMEFLYAVYLSALSDTLKVLLKAELILTEKLKCFFALMSQQYTRELAAYHRFGMYTGRENGQQEREQRRQLFQSAAEWMLSLEEVPDAQMEDFCKTGTFVCAAAEYAAGWISFKKLFVSFLIDQKRLDEARGILSELQTILSANESLNQ